jgi:hypothetical protein
MRMTSIALCVLAALAGFVAARRSLVAGILTVLGVGYAYGIVRANLLETFSHFIFDAAVVGLYLGQLRIFTAHAKTAGFYKLKRWFGVLVLWPMLLFLLPLQDPLIQLVGFRGNAFLLPFLLIGATLKDEDLYRLAMGVAVLNLLAFVVGGMEYFLGIEHFFPQNSVTELIYLSNDVANYTAFRIPSVFTSAHAFAGTMVMTIPLLLGAWVQKSAHDWPRPFIFAVLCVSILGVFLSATRSHFIVMSIVLLASIFFDRLKFTSRLIWLVALVSVGLLVSRDKRLQRFEGLSDTDMVVGRIVGSVNSSLLEVASKYPLGNGLGGGGTSIPYFLQHLIRNRVLIENEYARILLEQGIPGLCMWIAFLGWVFTRKGTSGRDPWKFGRRLAWFTCAGYFATGLIGTGLLTSIPQTCLLLATTGWIAVPKPVEAARPTSIPDVQAQAQLPVWHYGQAL